MANPSKVANYTAWSEASATDVHVEKLLDTAAYTSAHPDDTVVLVGPPRLNDPAAAIGDLAVVGMLQNISINQSKPFQPMMSIGSSRTFYTAGKAQGSAQIGRLFLNTDNLMKKLYANFTKDGSTITPTSLQLKAPSTPGTSDSDKFFINLDSNYFLVPFGLGVVFRDKTKTAIGGLYMELCVIPNYTISVQAGQSMIMEGVSVLFDRVVPLNVANAADSVAFSALDSAINGAGV